MKKMLAVLSAVLFLCPSVSFAAINNLNGLSVANQTFATTSNAHLLIKSSGNTHTFSWDGVMWQMNQGGTGASFFATGSIPFIGSGKFAENNLQLFWNAVTNALSIGGTTTPQAKLSVKGTSSLDLLNVASVSGQSQLFVSSSGNVGIHNINPSHALDVSGAIYSRLVSLPSASSINVDWSMGNVQSITLSTNTTFTFSGAQPGGQYTLIVKQDTTGNRTAVWPNEVLWPNGVVPSLSTNSNGKDVTRFTYDGENYLGSYDLHFSSSPVTSNIAVLVVGGGGSGSNSNGSSGGGAGGVVYNSAFPVSIQSYVVTIGAGGSGGGAIPTNGNDGQNSAFNTLTAYGGGHGSRDNVNGGNGGSGGGGGGPTGLGGVGVGGQGYGGGDGMFGINGGGGGGGCGGVGGSATPTNGGNGGNGCTYTISGSAVTYAGGGGAGVTVDGGTGGIGGSGGGGDHASNAIANTGGGGGGGDYPSLQGGSGGSGIVIVSYPTGSLTATGGAITTAGGNTIHTFTSSGSFTVTSIP